MKYLGSQHKVSETGFVLGIKQLSLHSKEVSHVHNTDPPQCHCLPTDLDSTASHSSHRTTVAVSLPCVWSLKHAMPPHSDLCKSNLRLTKPTTQMCFSAYLNQNPRNSSPSTAVCADIGFGSPHTRHQGFLTPWSDSGYTCRHVGLIVCRSTKPENLALIWCCTGPHAPLGVHATRRHIHPRTEKQLHPSSDVFHDVSPDDIIRWHVSLSWRHHPVNLSQVISHVSSPRQ